VFDSVAIVGVGLIGASIGMALKRRGLCRRVLGIGRRAESLETARQRGAIDVYTLDFGPELSDFDLVILCAPVDRIPELAERAAPFLDSKTTITDAGSTKAEIVRQIESRLPRTFHFVGSHPLAGSEKRGPQAACDRLFEGKTCVVTPTPASDPNVVSAVTKFWMSLGMRVVLLDPDWHDAILARTSHLPHLVASALACSLGVSDTPLVASGFRDTTRIASSDPDIWSPIFAQNGAALLAALDRFEIHLHEFRSALNEHDLITLRRLLQKAKDCRDALGS
jgi:prephenate dehydrogenase